MLAPLLFDDGSATQPSISFISEPSLGWYRSAAGQLTAAAGGGAVARFNATNQLELFKGGVWYPVLTSAGITTLETLTIDPGPLTVNGDATITGTTTIAGGTIDGTIIGGTTPAAGAFTTFTSNGINDNTSGERLLLTNGAVTLGTAGAAFQVRHVANDQFLAFSGGTSDSSDSAGANLIAYGATHATAAGDFLLRTSGTNVIAYDHSATTLTLTASGGVVATAGPFTSRGIDDNATVEVLEVNDASIDLGPSSGSSDYNIRMATGEGRLRLTGDVSQNAGANIVLYGATNATPNDFLIRTDATNVIAYDHSVTTLDLAANTRTFSTSAGTEQARLDSTGRLGLGIAPAYELDMYRSGTANLTHVIRNDNVTGLFQTVGSSHTAYGTVTNHPTLFLINNSETMRIGTTGNLLVGTTSDLGDRLHISDSGNDLLRVATTGSNANVQVHLLGSASAASTSSVLLRMYSNSGEHARIGTVTGTTAAAGDMLFYTHDATNLNLKFTLTQEGYLEFDSTNAEGVRFPADLASSDANTLDDYEEGSWSVGMQDFSSNNITPSVTSGRYTKVGNLVTVFARFAASSLGSASGQIRMTGLPFTVGAHTNMFNAYCGFGNGLAIPANSNVTGYADAGQTYIAMLSWNSTAGTGSFTAAQLSADGDIMLTAQYHV
jgi:hypothetical protein